MFSEHAFWSRVAVERGNGLALNVGIVALGVLSLGLLAQISIPLPFTPVPITGQTFGVTLISLLWGRKRAFASLGAYLIAGTMGLPLFAQNKFGLIWGPTGGYLLGMLFSSYVVGYLADQGWVTNSLAASIASSFHRKSGGSPAK